MWTACGGARDVRRSRQQALSFAQYLISSSKGPFTEGCTSSYKLDRFIEFKRFFESVSTWRYSWQTDILRLNFEFDPAQMAASFRTSETVVLTIEKMLREKLIDNLDGYMQTLFNLAHLAKLSPEAYASPVLAISDRLGLDRAGDSIWNALIDWAAGPFKIEVKALTHMAVRDLTPQGGAPIIQLRPRSAAPTR